MLKYTLHYILYWVSKLTHLDFTVSSHKQSFDTMNTEFNVPSADASMYYDVAL